MMWRETGRTTTVLGIDARVMLSFVVFMLHWSWTTLWVVLATLAFFMVLNQFGYTFPNAMRRARVLLLFGRRRPAMPFWRRTEWR
jgi:intracellular multiplication protein IcmT